MEERRERIGLMTMNIPRPRLLLLLFAAAILAAGLLALVEAKPAWAVERSFPPAQHYPVGSTPTTVTNADFNGDGNVDLAAQNAGDNTVSVLLGNGDGTFQTARNVPVGFAPTSVTSADFNGDSKADLAVANWSSNNVSVLLGNGDGTFQAKKDFAAHVNPTSVTSAHFNDDNADGKVASADFVDLAVANYSSDDVTILLSNGDGTFGAPQPYSIRPPCPRTGTTADCPTGLCFDFGCVRNPVVAGPNQVVAADFNRDGRADIATASVGDFECDALRPPFPVCTMIFIPGGISVLLSNPDGTFQGAKRIVRDTRTDSIATEDFNGDGKVDLVATEIESNVVSVLPGNGDGTFQTAQKFSVGTNPSAVTSADLDADNRADLAVTNFTSDNVSVLFNNGSGGFNAAQNFAVGDGPIFATSAHFNDDGEVDLADLAVANQNSNNISVLGPPPPPDRRAPITTHTLSPEPNAARWHKSDVTVTLNATDTGGSSVKNIRYSATGAQPIDSTTVPGGSATVKITTEGTTTISYFATDNATNEEESKTVTINLDKSAPQVTPGDVVSNVWRSSSLSEQFTASDGGSGLANSADASFTLTASEESASATQPTVVSRTVFDVAGNSTTRKVSALIDLSAPTLDTDNTDGSDGITPNNKQTGVSRTIAPTATFSDEMNPASLGTSIKLYRWNAEKKVWQRVPATVSVEGKKAKLDPYGATEGTTEQPLAANTRHKVTASTGATNLAGLSMASPKSWTFTTRA